MDNFYVRYNIAQKYEIIIDQLIKHIYNNSASFCTREQSYTETLQTLIRNTNHTIYEFLKECDIIKKAIRYEITQYENKPTLQKAESNDLTVLWSLDRNFYILQSSFIETTKFLKVLYRTLNNHHISKSSEITKAITYTCKKHIERCNDKRRNILPDYLLLTIIRPYYIHLQRKNIALKTDMEQHVSMQAAYETAEPEINAYLQLIIDYAQSTKNTNHIRAREIEYEKLQNDKQDQKQKKQIELAQKKQLQYKNRMYKFVTEKEKVYHNIAKIPRALRLAILDDPNYHCRIQNCCVIVLLIKPEKGNSVFQYKTKNGTSTNIQTAEFFFDENGLSAAKEECSNYPNVVCVDTIRIL